MLDYVCTKAGIAVIVFMVLNVHSLLGSIYMGLRKRHFASLALTSTHMYGKIDNPESAMLVDRLLFASLGWTG